ncbi:hypothetical protein AB0I68_18700 [Streptomyces sp. NPDC050448]|uniref:hypothetical protein n=1 Tax=Streptomyces sp. NPDC050448 TaxID=3155404 RepID=UPI00341DA911
MPFDEEWSAARATAATNVSMRLNHVPVEPGGGGGGDLELNQDHIGAIGTEAYKLHSRLQTDGKHAATATGEAAGALTKESFTIRHTTSEIRHLMDQHAHTPRPPAAHLNTLAGLLVHATAHGATLTTETKPTC